jgi:hypothetical protein
MRPAPKRDAPNLFDADPPAPTLTPNVETDLRRLLQAMFEQIGSVMKTRGMGNEQNPD